MATTSTRFKTDLRELRFVLFEQLRLGEILGKPPFGAALGEVEVDMLIKELEKQARDTIAPLNGPGDRVGCRLDDGQVTTPPGFRDAWRQLYESGWYQLTAPEDLGGQAAPYTLHAVVTELVCGANPAFSMYPGLTYGAAEVIHAFGTRDQKERYLRRLYDGVWSGTMCLTEPHAGSDVGAARTSARKLPDGSYAIRGTKIFISAGDHDLTENVVHLVLARVEGAAPGTKGLSLFIVPKRRLEGDTLVDNDVTTASIEHKLGLSASATASLVFGENDGCRGEVVGGVENVGMSQMFKLMNGARIGVALQGIAVGAQAYYNALEYARERKQGASIAQWKDATAPRVPILEHADVRRMLLDMKARVEGIRLLVYTTAMHRDRAEVLRGKDDAAAAYHQGQVDLFTPICKSYSSDQAFRICETAIQVFGGAGYVKDHPVEQALRDSKVFSIYEGTNHIQAMDLVGRKIALSGGQTLRAFLSDVATFVQKHRADPAIGPEAQLLGQGAEALGGAAMQLLGWFQSGKMPLVPLAANRFLEMMAETVVSWLLLDGARIATERAGALPADHPDRAFYAGKLHAARYYARNVLPGVTAKAQLLRAEDTSPIDIPDDGFGPA